MGEAKRRSQQSRQLADEIEQRIAAGDFGAPQDARAFCIVLDRGQRSRDMLKRVSSTPRLPTLAPLFEGEPFRLWDLSQIFRFVVLCGGEGTVQERTLLAADMKKLVGEVLPRAAARMRAQFGREWGSVIAVEDDALEAARQALGARQG
ncbi:MAG TPA: hypothetical protein VN680_02630 [Burkholderiaceae bacterium]|jgi:hypothetical protein|nr:hypothetical protein [Burkholderiaceae bacterium]